jgi:hypothetical protein
MRPWLRYCDYVGVDIYIGCFASVGNAIWMYDAVLRYLHSYVKKPLLLTEFGYMSGGSPKSAGQRRKVLQKYGAHSEAHARAEMDAFVAHLPETMRNQVLNNASGDWGDFLFNSDFRPHFYAELPEGAAIKGYPHTPRGQAKFFTDIYPRLVKYDFLIGAFLYCYADARKCYICGQSDCPVETRWGITTVDGKEKPSYRAVRDALRKIR